MFWGDLIVAFQYFMEAYEKYEKGGTDVSCCIGHGVMVLNEKRINLD